MKSKLFLSGIIILIASIVISVLGMIWGIYNSFDALAKNETAGIDQVGVGVENALIFAIVSIIGSAIGIILMIVGVIRLGKS